MRNNPYARLGVSRAGGLLLAKKLLSTNADGSWRNGGGSNDRKRKRGPPSAQGADVRAALAAAMRDSRSGRQRRPTERLLSNVVNLPERVSSFTS